MYLAAAQAQSTTVSNNNSKSNTQQWVDKINNMRIQFNNLPQSPVVDAKTQLHFSVQNITNSKNINDLHARVVVTTNSSGQMRIFKFENISSSKGDFSVNYFFPDSLDKGIAWNRGTEIQRPCKCGHIPGSYRPDGGKRKSDADAPEKWALIPQRKNAAGNF